jgi:hypothetical protein
MLQDMTDQTSSTLLHAGHLSRMLEVGMAVLSEGSQHTAGTQGSTTDCAVRRQQEQPQNDSMYAFEAFPSWAERCWLTLP